MANQLRVDPEALTRAGNTIGNHAETLHALHRSCHAEAAETRAGWVGSSAGALSGLLDSWQTASTAHFQRIGAQSDDMNFAAAEFHFMERRHQQAFNDVDAAAGTSGTRTADRS